MNGKKVAFAAGLMSFAGAASAGIYSFDLQSNFGGNFVNGAPAPGFTAVLPPAGVGDPAPIVFAEGSVDFTEINSWSNAAHAPIANDFWFVENGVGTGTGAVDGGGNPIPAMDVTVSLNDPSEIAVIEFYYGGANESQSHFYTVINDGGTGTLNQVVEHVGPGDGSIDSSVFAPIVGDGGVYRLTRADGNVRISGFTIYTGNDVPEPGSLALLGLGGLAMLRRRR